MRKAIPMNITATPEEKEMMIEGAKRSGEGSVSAYIRMLVRKDKRRLDRMEK